MDILQYKEHYVSESLDLLSRLELSLVLLEEGRGDLESVRDIFRVMHTIKGSSGMYGFSDVVKLSHDLETFYGAVESGTHSLNAEAIQLTFEVSDYFRWSFTHDASLGFGDNHDYQVLQHKLNQLLHSVGLGTDSGNGLEAVSSSLEGTGFQVWRISFKPDSSISSRNINLSESLGALFCLGEAAVCSKRSESGDFVWVIELNTDSGLGAIEDALFFILDYCTIELASGAQASQEEDSPLVILPGGDTSVDILGSPVEHNLTDGQALKQISSKISVESAKIDTLIYLVSELVTAKSELITSVENQEIIRIAEATEKIDKLSKQFRDNALNIRLVSLHEVVGRFRRLVRDLAKQLGKEVIFEVSGEDTELDKNIVEALWEPLVHLLRNCIDHGIEFPEERVKVGKGSTGIVKFFAYKSGSFVFIQVSDDGRGINREAVLTRAIERDLISSTQILNDKEIYDLLFEPGFSTSEQVSLVSGRGIGMDIVRRKLRDLRGEIFITSEYGLGTSFTLKLQQTISIIDTLLIQSASAKYAIPIEDIESCELTSTVHFLNRQNKHLPFQGDLIPYVYLHEVFQTQEQGLEKQKVIVINKYGRRFAVIADEIIGEYQAVIKPIGILFHEIDFISGASILGNGGIALLIDTGKLINLITPN
ncbi:MAG: chemotaxis protein CheA [Bacteroidia bacterium]|nr:chemotaxis protein CheA [Bacteroidia bacterium]MCZ2356540.1 chemotaxis protein CheA [Bacteroidia bacterium]